ncbi:glycosyl hydrolase family 65 protein [soil metagenome]
MIPIDPERLASAGREPLMSKNSTSADVLGTAPWHLLESDHDPARAALHETLFTLGNGRIGVRGAHEEGECWPGTEQDAVYLNGFYDSEEIRYPENAYGLARHNQFMVNVPNGKAIGWQVDGEVFDPSQGRMENYRRHFDFRSGLLTREFVWTSPRGQRVAVSSKRLVCLARQHIYAIEYDLCLLDGPATLVIESALDARARGLEASDDPRVGSSQAAQALEWSALERGADHITLTHRTRHSGLVLVSAVEQTLRQASGAASVADHCGEIDQPGLRYTLQLARGERASLHKYCALVSSLDHPAGELAARAAEQLAWARSAGFDALCDEQQARLDSFWADADVEIDGDPALQQGLRFNLLHLLQSAGRDGRTNIAAKGVTGSGYDGHYFWDTEIYIFPVLLYTQPEIARKLLEFRFRTLDSARARAREMNHLRGALFPWRTIAGEECSSYFPAGTAQFHINADIAYAVKSYWEATGDDDFMKTLGAELVFETARVWLDLGHTDGERFCIHAVTGPDEYTALVNNNLYTNAMAQMHLDFAADTARWLADAHPDTLIRLTEALSLEDDEPARWRQAAARMALPYDHERGIHPQDDSFLSKPRWDVAAMDPAKRPLLLHYHPLVIYRHQVCKQADVLLAVLLLADRFEAADKRRNFDYYEPLTTHDSSLSRCIFGIVATEVGYHEKAYGYFVDGARADLDDHHHNTRHGVHTAAMAGAWLGVVAGFAGLRLRQGLPTFTPHLPNGWTRYAFKLRARGSQVSVTVDGQGTCYRLVGGPAFALDHSGASVLLSTESPTAMFPTAHVAPALVGAQS